MDNVIHVPFDIIRQLQIHEVHNSPGGGFKSANKVAEITGFRISVVKAILKRGKKYQICKLVI